MKTTYASGEIVTIDKDHRSCLAKICEAIPITETGLEEARKTIEKLKSALAPLMPAAGLAASQIGINERVFIFSYDRTPENLMVAINPAFTPLEETLESCWEGCFSAILRQPCQIACVPRYTKILAEFYDEQGNFKQYILEKFAARVFQHEWDHLNGVVNIHKDNAEIKSFASLEEMNAFLAPIKAKIDTSNYIKPTEYGNHQ